MRTKLFTLFLALAAAVGTMYASVIIDGIAYNLNESELTAEVTSLADYSGSIVIPDDVTYDTKTYNVTGIGFRAFRDRTGVTAVTIGKNVTSIGENAFYNCRSLTSVSVPDSGVVSIGEGAFALCSALTSLTIPGTVTSIDDNAFNHCSGLTSLTIPNSVTSIGDMAFYYCTSLSSLTIPNATILCNPHSFPFIGCTNLTTVNLGEGAMFVDFENPSLPMMSELGKYINAYEQGIKNINVDANNPYYSSIDGVLYDKMQTTLLCHSTRREADAYVIPDGVMTIGSFAFYNCGSLTSVTFPNGLQIIGRDAFAYTGLTSLTLPNSVTDIEDHAFLQCRALASITCEAVNPPRCGLGAFYDVSKDIPVYVPQNSVYAYRVEDEWEEFFNIQPISTTDISTITPSADTNGKVLRNGQLFILRDGKLFNAHGARLE